MTAWGGFAAAEPALAELARALLFQFRVGLAFLATLRADGAPRVHPVCPVLSGDRLFVMITVDSPKRRDLERDGRFALQAFPQARPASDELYIAGRAVPVEDPVARAAVLRDARHMAQASERVFELQLDRVMHTRWEQPLTPGMRPVRTIWRAPGARRGGRSDGAQYSGGA